MNKKSNFLNLALGIVAVSFLMVAVPTTTVNADTRKCGDMKWEDKDHGDNNPSSGKFYKMAYNASICEVAKCVDHSVCADHEKVNIDKFKDSPAYTQASDKIRDELDESMKDGHGAEGLVGYEILYAVEEAS